MKKKLKQKLYFLESIFLLYLLFSLIRQSPDKTINISLDLYKRIYPNTLCYKGENVSKSKLLNDYLSKISDDYLTEKEVETQLYNQYYYLANYNNESLIKSKLKTKFLEYISRLKKQITTKIDIFYLSYNINFGNNLIVVNNAIFYCEIVGCSKIILNNSGIKRRWLIIKPIYDKTSNITIMQGSNVNCENKNILCLYEVSWSVFFPRIFIPQVRTELIKLEILSNLPKVKIEKNELFIHIRGGDIFKSEIENVYAQPPLCFYEKILNNSECFKKIYIISMDRANVVVDALLKKYKNIIHKINNFEYDISLLCHAYNIVLSVSSFVLSSIKLNDNLKNIWEFDIMRLSTKFLFLHHYIFKFKIKYKIHTMKPSDKYINKMFKWINSKEQHKLMLEDECPHDFVITKINI